MLVLDIPFTPTAKKNSRMWVRRAGRMVSLPNEKAQRHQQAIRTIVRQALMHKNLPVEFLKGRRVALSMAWHADEDKVAVVIEDLGDWVPLPGIRRDLDNMVQVVLDALNHLVWEDDSQIVDLRVVTVRT